jgi:hypothetical protein
MAKASLPAVDGPEFDAHQVNFEVLVQRNSMYRDAEQRSMAEFQRALDAKKGRRQVEAACAVFPGGER